MKRDVMSASKRIFIVEDMKQYTGKFLLSGIRKQVKGFIRLGHDVHRFDYGGAFWQLAPVKSKLLSRRWCKGRVDELLVKQLKSYEPDIIHISFANFIDIKTIALIRQAVPDAFIYGCDGDPWPEYQTNRVDVGSKLDLILATNDGNGLMYTEKPESAVNSCLIRATLIMNIVTMFRINGKPIYCLQGKQRSRVNIPLTH